MLERLQKIIAASGITSRRKAEELILQGAVTLNGRTVTKLGTKADSELDHIKVGGKLLRGPGRPVYLLLNKPRGYVTTVSDPLKRPTVLDLIKGTKGRIFPAGRLDLQTSGLLVLTNDGELAERLTTAAYRVPKTYHAKVHGMLDPKTLKRMEKGITLDRRKMAPCTILPLAEGDKSWYEITLIEGRYHHVRRMFEAVGHPVAKLSRVRIGCLTAKGLRLGQFRNLRPGEVQRLKHWKG